MQCSPYTYQVVFIYRWSLEQVSLYFHHIYVAGFKQPCKVSSHSPPCNHRQAPGAMPAPSAAKRGPSPCVGDIRHHLQVHRDCASGCGPVHLQRGTLPAPGIRRHECEAWLARDLRDAYRPYRSPHQTSIDRSSTGVATWTRGRVWVLWKVKKQTIQCSNTFMNHWQSQQKMWPQIEGDPKMEGYV